MSLREQVEDLGRQLPQPVKAVVKRSIAPADVGYRWAWRRRTGQTHKVPPMRLRVRVGGGMRLDQFVEGGKAGAQVLADVLRDHRVALDDRTVLDFGCGCGRLLAGFLQAGLVDPASTRLHGCDVDHEAIVWCRRNMPEARFAVNDYSPPLPYDEATFDVLWSSSIFTHLPEARGNAWLEEIRRVLVPGGIALVTVAGRAMFDIARGGHAPQNNDEFMERLRSMPDLDAEGIVYVPYERGRWNDRDFPGIDDSYGLTYHSRTYVAERWGGSFDVLDHRPRAMNHAQDLVVLRKPAA